MKPVVIVYAQQKQIEYCILDTNIKGDLKEVIVMKNLYSVLMSVSDEEMEMFEKKHNIYCFC